MSATHDLIELKRELVALARADAAAPGSRRILAALESAHAVLYEALRQDMERYVEACIEIEEAAKRPACERCGSLGYVGAFQHHAGSFVAEPIAEPCGVCCTACTGTGIVMRDETIDEPIFDLDGEVVGHAPVTQTRAEYCWCTAGTRRREQDEGYR